MRDLQIEALKNKYNTEKKNRSRQEKMCNDLLQQLSDLEVFGDSQFTSTVQHEPMASIEGAGDTGHLPDTYHGPPIIAHRSFSRSFEAHFRSLSEKGRLLKISRALACILRHQAEDRGIQVRSDGFVQLDKALYLLRHQGATVEDVRKVVADSRHCDGSYRFELRESAHSGLLIRATDMHTIPHVTVDASNTQQIAGPPPNPQTASPASLTSTNGTGEVDLQTDSASPQAALATPLITSFGRCLAQFDGTQFGPEYLILEKDEEVDLVSHPDADANWVYGQARGIKGWLPTEFWEHR